MRVMSSELRRAAGAFDVALAIVLVAFVAVTFLATSRYQPLARPVDPGRSVARLTRAPSGESTLTIDSLVSGAAPSRPLPPAGTPIRIAAGTSVTVAGWAVTDRNRSPASAVVAEIDGSARILATYGLPRPDVAATLAAPALRNSGFRVVLPGRDLPAGTHVVRFDVISRDGEATSAMPERLDLVAAN